MMKSPSTILSILQGNDLPANSVSIEQSGAVVIQWSALATTEQKSQGQALADAYQPADVEDFIDAVWADQNLVAVRSDLIVYKPLIYEYIQMGFEGFIRLQEAWTGVKVKLDAVNPALAPIVEQYAQAHHVPIVGS